MSTNGNNKLVIFNIIEEKQVLESLFKKYPRLKWGGTKNREVKTYYLDSIAQNKYSTESDCKVGVFIIRYGTLLYWRDRLLYRDDLKCCIKEYSDSQIVDLRVKEDINYSTKDIYVCDKENKVYHLKEVRVLDKSQEICLSFDSEDRLFNNLEEANEQFFTC